MCLGDINFVYMFQYVAVIGWLVTGALYFIVTYVPSLDNCMYGFGIVTNCHWSDAGAVTMASLYRVMWGVWVCWLIVACHTGWGGQFLFTDLCEP